MTDPRHALGLRAEHAVATWLAGCGWTILARRWRVAEGELDLVGLDPDGALVGVEVRARRTSRTGCGAESLRATHLARLRAALARYASGAPVRHRELRVDVVALEPMGERWRVTHLRGVDGW